MLQKRIADLTARFARRGPPDAAVLADAAAPADGGATAPDDAAPCRVRQVPTTFDAGDAPAPSAPCSRGGQDGWGGLHGPAPAGRKPIETLLSAARFGSDGAQAVNLSSRQAARVDSDPFVQRLARLE